MRPGRHAKSPSRGCRGGPESRTDGRSADRDAVPPAPAMLGTESPCAYPCDLSLARRAHPAEIQSCAPQRRDDASDEINIGRDFNTHPLAALELDLDGCRPSRRGSSPRRPYVLFHSSRRFLDCFDGRKLQRRSNTRARSSIANQPFGPGLSTPREELAGVNAALPSHLRHRMAGTAGLFDDLELLFLAPA